MDGWMDGWIVCSLSVCLCASEPAHTPRIVRIKGGPASASARRATTAFVTTDDDEDDAPATACVCINLLLLLLPLAALPLLLPGGAGAAKDEFNANVVRLSELSQKYSNNVIDATKAFSIIVEDPADMDGEAMPRHRC
jgi:hypothetical protein